MTARALILLAVLVGAAGCVAGDGSRARAPEAMSLLGRPLHPMPLSPDVRAEREQRLEDARAAYAAHPRDESAVIWLGRRTAYLGRYRDAVAVFTEGLRDHPNSYRLLRHRGHRLITLRRFDEAIEDLERAAALIEGVPDEVEPDGLPNRLNIPTSTSHTNIYYHLGLARYLRGEWDAAARAWGRCLDFARNDDMRCAASYWRYLALRRAGRDGEAAAVLGPIHADMDIIENVAYHRLCLLFDGVIGPADVAGGAAPPVGREIEDATAAYGLAMWYRFRGDEAVATARLRRLADGPAWPAFGAIAAEADLSRRRP